MEMPIPRAAVGKSLTSRVVVDADILGWAKDHASELANDFEVTKVGSLEGLPQDSSDAAIAKYCSEHSCNLLTADSTAYKEYFDAGVKEIVISSYGRWEEGKRPILLLRFIM